jgi:hypothetical protein
MPIVTALAAPSDGVAQKPPAAQYAVALDLLGDPQVCRLFAIGSRLC